MEMLCLAIGLVAGITGTFIFFKVLESRKKAVGVLRVDRSDPEDGPYLFLELKNRSSMDEIVKSQQVLFDVSLENYVTQK